jgi:LPXTG-motif cell wall-anchored protein
MDTQYLTNNAPLILLAAALLLALGVFLARKRRSAPPRIAHDAAKKMLALTEAATSVYDAAKHERMVVVTVAEKADDGPLSWFARSIASVVPVYRIGLRDAFEKLQGGANIGTDLQSLYIQKRDYLTYVRWARSMQ